MDQPIVNRVAQSKLKTIDLEDFYPSGNRSTIDISQWLLEGMVLVESRFRESIKATDFSKYDNHYVAIICSTDAIIPQWAWMLLQSALQPHVKKMVLGSQELLETILYKEIIDKIDLSEYQDLPVIIKGCSNKPVPLMAYTMLTEKLMPVARSVMYGEACSSVPVYKRKKPTTGRKN